MPSKRITDYEVHKYHRKKLNLDASAAKAGISARSVQRIEDGTELL